MRYRSNALPCASRAVHTQGCNARGAEPDQKVAKLEIARAQVKKSREAARSGAAKQQETGEGAEQVHLCVLAWRAALLLQNLLLSRRPSAEQPESILGLPHARCEGGDH